MQFYRESGVQVGSQDCQDWTVLLATCLELYPVCSASPSRSSCSLSCDRWKLHMGSTCTCSGAEDCPSVLQQVVGVCPLSEGHTLFTSSGVQCQRLSVGECEEVHTCTHTQMCTHINVHTHACTVHVIKKLTHARTYIRMTKTACTMGSVYLHRTCGWISACVCGLCLCVQTYTEESQVALSLEKHSE